MRPAAEQLEVLRRGVEQIVREEELIQKLERSAASGRPLRVKYGIDPTGIDVHLGHTVPLRKLRQFQDLGHTAVVIIGDYTAMVGDPSGRDKTRAGLTREQVEANARDYLRQIGRIIDLDRAEVRHNGEWFGRWTLLDVLDLMRRMTVGQVSARDDFAARIKGQQPVYLSECLYPLMQGWDSVEIRADVELGGTEQLFNLLVGRDLQQEQGQEPQVAMTLPILVGTDGERRMGKSLGNYIGLAEEPNAQFGKLMSIPDGPMRLYFTLLTDLPLAEVDRLLGPEVNPRDAKEVLGKAVVAQYHGAGAADAAAEAFARRARREDSDDDVAHLALISSADLDTMGCMPAPKLIVKAGLRGSTSQARQLIQGGGFSYGPERTTTKDVNALVTVVDGMVVRAGSRMAAKIQLKD